MPSPRKSTASAKRQQRYRARQRAGKASFRVEADEMVLFALVEAERLTDSDLADRKKVERALTEVLLQWADEWRREIFRYA